MKDRYDIVIAGGGMVGASLALALRDSSLQIAMVEPVPISRDDQPSFDGRTIALSRSSQRILAALELWPAVREHAQVIRRIHVSERGRFGTAVIDAEEQGIDELGWVVRARDLGQAIYSAIESQHNLSILCPARLAAPRVTPTTITVAIDGESVAGSLEARLLVVADGARSQLREALGVGVTTRAYDQTAIVTNIEVSRPAEAGLAFERFTADGPLALLPAGGRRYIAILSRRDADEVNALCADDEALKSTLQSALGFRLGRIARVGKRSSYPLALTRAERVTSCRAAIIGNAAHGLHPVAGQGYNLGLRDVAALADQIAAAAAADGDPGSESRLDEYARWRAHDQRNVAAFTDGLIRLFDLPFAGPVRGLGLLAFDLAPVAKRALAYHTMGLSGRLSRLARGLRP